MEEMLNEFCRCIEDKVDLPKERQGEWTRQGFFDFIIKRYYASKKRNLSPSEVKKFTQFLAVKESQKTFEDIWRPALKWKDLNPVKPEGDAIELVNKLKWFEEKDWDEVEKEYPEAKELLKEYQAH
jgi:hypothetical protein